MSALSCHVNLALYADNTALIVTSYRPSLLVIYLETYLGRLEHWLWDWRVAVSISKSTAVIFAKIAGRIQ
jgi:hypothetical protein